jgi:hypothetical protein
VDVLGSADVIDIGVAADAVVLADVLGRDHHLLPPHIEVIARVTVGAEYRDLGARPRKAGVDKQQPQPGLLR